MPIVTATVAELYPVYHSVPYTDVESNQPYAAGEDPADIAARKAAKLAFIAGTEEWPQLEYPLLDKAALDFAEHEYLGVMDALLSQDKSAQETPEWDVLYELNARNLAQVYRYKEVLRRLDLPRRLSVLAINDETERAKRVEQSRTRAANASAELFGDVDPDRFYAMLGVDIRAAIEGRNSSDPLRRQVAQEYIDLLALPEDRLWDLASYRSPDKSDVLRDDTIRIIRGDIYRLFPGVEKAMKRFSGRRTSTKPIDAQPAFDAFLEGYDVARKGWTSRVLPESKQSAEAVFPTREITYGENRASFEPDAIVRVPAHEGFHAVHRQNASEQDELHRQQPMPGSLGFGEGCPTNIEQILTGIKRTVGMLYYIQLGLLQGLHLPDNARAEQSSRTVNELMWRRAALLSTGTLNEAKLAKHRDKVYDSVLRTTRGGARDNRDISYSDGAREATHFFNETATLPQGLRLARLQWAFSMVFSPANPKHVEWSGGDPAAAYLERRRQLTYHA